MGAESSAKRLSHAAHHGPPARSTGLTPERKVDRLPQSEVSENCSTKDSTVLTCRIDAQTLMKLSMQDMCEHGKHTTIWA